MDKQPVGQLPNLTQSNNDDEIMVITNSEYNQLKKEKIADFITDLTSTDENNAIVKGTDGKMFVTDFGNASNITEGTLPTSVLPDIPKDKLPQIETDDLPDSGITAGTYTYPTDIVINSKGQVTSITEGQPGANNANQDLSNLGPLGLDKINQSKALETGSVSSDADVYADIQKYAHSTFDLSKFEVVGSPTITEDGVASGFSNNDYIKSNYEFDLTKSWETRITFQTPNSNLQYNSGIGQFEVNLNNNTLLIRADYKLLANFNTGVNFDLISNVIMEKNTKYTAVIGWDLRNYYLKILDHTCKLIDTIKSENNAPLAISDSKRKYRIGKIFDFADGRYKFQGSIDLKQFSITADGVEVFNGNKTGIDTIKPDNYEVVGTPTITADGMFCNNSSDKNLIKIPLTYGDFLNKSWEVRTCAYVEPNVNKTYIVFDNNYATLGSLFWSSGLKICAKFGDASDSTGEIYVAPLSTSTPEGWYNLSMAFNYTTGEYTCKAINIATGTVYSNTYTPTTANKQLHTFNTKTASTKINLIRAKKELVTDLNGVQVYFDGNLVYQPCLKIPYTLSNTGSKIVDVYARNRVQDLYEQTGEALYYTIDEENQNFTLPMGEIYGMIERKNNELNNPFSLFDYKYTDAPIYNASWLKSDGTFYAKSVYVSAYEALVVENNSDITAGTTTTLPSGGSYTKRGLSVKLSTASYTDTDFVINTTDETFRLPLTTKAVPFAGGSFPVVGTGIALGLTNARDSRVLTLQSNSDGAEINVNGGGQTLPYQYNAISRPENGYVMGLSKDSSKSGVVAKVSGTTGLNLYFYVGETVQNAYLIDAGQIAENIADKANTDLSNCSKPYVTETYRNGSSWYRKWSDGFIEQGGRTTMGDTYGEVLKFLVPFSSTDDAHNSYIIVGVLGAMNATSNLGILSYGYTGVNIDNSVGGTYHWYAAGY